MSKVKISPKFQIVIPKDVRESLNLKQGEELQVIALDGSIRVHRLRPTRELFGAARGLKWKDEYRDRGDRH
jgi:AbrB family looped-hinge helix DNA binding protein